MESTMVTSGTMTNRIDQLEKSGLVTRIPNPQDGRGFLISLTDAGFAVINDAATAHVDTQARLVSGLSKDELNKLDSLLRKYLKSFESK